MPLRDTASAQPFMSPAERRQHGREVDQIVKLAAEGKYPEALWPVAASVGFGPQDLKRLPVEVAAGVAEAQERLAARRAPVGRNLASLIELCGIETLLREDPRDVMVCLRTAAARSSGLFLARSMRCNEAAMGERLSHASANVTVLEAQRAGSTGMRLMQASAQMEQVRQKLDIEAGKAERAGFLLPEARQDEIKRGRRISERVESDRAREEAQRRRDEHELAMAIEAAAQDAAARRAMAAASGTAPSGADEAEGGQNRQSTPCKASDALLLSPQRGERPAGAEGGEPQSRSESSGSTTDAALSADRHATPYTVSGEAGSDEPIATATPAIAPPSMPVQSPRRGRRAMAAARAAARAAERAVTASNLIGTARPVDPDVEGTPSDILPLSPQRGERPAGAEGKEPQSRSETHGSTTDAALAADHHATPYTVSGDSRLCTQRSDASATAELLVPAAMLPLPLADRRAAASDALRALQGPDAKDDPANGWEVEMLGIAVRTGKASASIVARFVEETTASDIFPEPGSAAGRRPSFHEFLGRLAPRGWPRVTATESSSVSLMA